jgi:hypothetical protein
MTLQFEPIEFEKKEDYAKLLAQCPQVASDYSFLNLWAWAQDYGLQWAWEDDLVWIRQTDPQVVYWAPIGAWEKIGWRARFNQDGREITRYRRVPQQLADCWRTGLGELPRVSEDRGNWDYIYACEDLIELKGNRYQAMNQMFLQNSAGDFAFVNREQDLNDEGLRKAKLSYLPADFLKKYQIELPGSFFS